MKLHSRPEVVAACGLIESHVELREDVGPAADSSIGSEEDGLPKKLLGSDEQAGLRFVFH